jgi:predicted nucleic acid-binding protein
MKSIYLLDTNTISEPIKKIPNEQVLEKLNAIIPFVLYRLLPFLN